MDYSKPEITLSYVAEDLRASAFGFVSVPGDDSPGHCGHDMSGPGLDASCP